MAKPREKRTFQDYWNIPFRGLNPGGLNDQPDNPALPRLTQAPDAPVMVDAEQEEPISKIDITDILLDPGEKRRVYFHTFQVQVGAIESVQVLGEDNTRKKAIIRNVGPGDVYIGDTESVGRTGYALAQSTNEAPFTVETTEKVWALQATGQASNAILHIFVEFDKQK